MRWNEEAKIKVWELALIWTALWINMILVIIAVVGMGYLA